MSSNEPETIEGNWTARPISNSARYVQYVGLEPVTLRNSDNQPYFFLFVDLDTKDKEILRSALNVARQNHLTVYFFESCKGWHIISPCLLKIRKWAFLLKRLQELQDYSGDTIRWTPRKCDGKLLYYQSWNGAGKFYEESYDLHYRIHERFMCDLTKEKLVNVVSTKLHYNIYYQLRLNLKRHY